LDWRTLVSLAETVSGRLTELRKWDLAPLGAILVVVLLAAGLYASVTLGGDKSKEAKVRAYFMSSEGGHATKEEARRIEVSTCQPTGDQVRGQLVISCAVSFGSRTFTACYAWDGDRLIAGGSQPVATCLPVLWDERTHSLVGVRQDQ
jgi:hypothetical protein